MKCLKCKRYMKDNYCNYCYKLQMENFMMREDCKEGEE